MGLIRVNESVRNMLPEEYGTCKKPQDWSSRQFQREATWRFMFEAQAVALRFAGVESDNGQRNASQPCAVRGARLR